MPVVEWSLASPCGRAIRPALMTGACQWPDLSPGRFACGDPPATLTGVAGQGRGCSRRLRRAEGFEIQRLIRSKLGIVETFCPDPADAQRIARLGRFRFSSRRASTLTTGVSLCARIVRLAELRQAAASP